MSHGRLGFGLVLGIGAGWRDCSAVIVGGNYHGRVSRYVRRRADLGRRQRTAKSIEVPVMHTLLLSSGWVAEIILGDVALFLTA